LKALNSAQQTAQAQPSSTTSGFLSTASTDLVCPHVSHIY